MNELNEKFYGLALKDVMAKYIKNYFDLHGDVLPPDGLYARIMNEVERPLIEETLKHMKGNQVRVAKILGIISIKIIIKSSMKNPSQWQTIECRLI